MTKYITVALIEKIENHKIVYYINICSNPNNLSHAFIFPEVPHSRITEKQYKEYHK